MGSNILITEDVPNFDSAYGKGIADQGAVASPGHGFGAHDGRALQNGEIDQFVQGRLEFQRLHVIGKASERGIMPAPVERVDLRVPKPAEGLHVPVADAPVSEKYAQCFAVELRIVPGMGNRADIDKPANTVPLQQMDKLIYTLGRMAHGENNDRRRCRSFPSQGNNILCMHDYYLLHTF
jgi:hypothetical protein